MTNKAYTEARHRWGNPLPGQGSEPICEACGARKSAAGAGCPGASREVVIETTHDYDPLA